MELKSSGFWGENLYMLSFITGPKGYTFLASDPIQIFLNKKNHP